MMSVDTTARAIANSSNEKITNITQDIYDDINITATNAIIKGDFTDITKWTSSNGTASIANNTLNIISTANDCKTSQNTMTPCISGHQIFVKAKCKVNTTGATSINIKCFNSNLVGTFINVVTVLLPEGNKEYDLFNIFTVPSNWTGNLRINIDMQEGVGKTFSISNVVMVDLTSIFGTSVPSRYTFMEILKTKPNAFFNETQQLIYKAKEKSKMFTEEDAPVIKSIIDDNWIGWSDTGTRFGLSPTQCPAPCIIEAPFIAKGTFISGGTNTNMMRWGFHVFEGYASDGKSRITMLINKHTEESKPLAELYYYLTAYTHGAESYGWFKLGSDVKQHSFMFSRDKAIAFGEWDLRNVMTLARISPSHDLNSTYQTIAQVDAAYEAETNSVENAKCLLYLALKNAQNGAMFYDTDRNKAIIKVNGKWCDMNVTDASSYYSF